MSDTNGGVPAGWYADPSGTQQQRWWDGTRWTGHYAPAAAAASAPAAYSQPGYPQMSPVYGQTYVPQRPQLAPGTRIYTVYIWLVVAVPFVTVVLLPFWNPFNGMSLTRTTNGYSSFGSSAAFLGPMYFIIIGTGFITYGLTVLFAWLDSRDLSRAGVERPFHWAWTFLSPIIYIIGRSVIVRRVAPGRGLAPIWVTIGLYVLSFVVSIIWTVALINTLSQLVSTSGYPGA